MLWRMKMPKVTLIKPGAGSTQWGTNVGQNWTDIENTFRTALYQRDIFEIFAEFINALNGTPFTTAASGTGAAGNTSIAGDSNHPGIVQIETGTTTTGRGAFQSNLSTIRLGGGAAVFEGLARIPTLPDGTESFAFRIGFGDSVSADMTDGVYFELTQADSDWQCKTANNSTRTTYDTGQAAAANTWTRLRIEVNADGTEANFYIDGTLRATISTNIPTGASRQLGVMSGVIKSAGTTERTAQIDYVYAQIEFTTAR